MINKLYNLQRKKTTTVSVRLVTACVACQVKKTMKKEKVVSLPYVFCAKWPLALPSTKAISF